MNKRRRWKAKARRAAKRPDHCEVCHGRRGGVRGNENIIDGVVMCDYCSADTMPRGPKFSELRDQPIFQMTRHGDQMIAEMQTPEWRAAAKRAYDGC